MLGFLRIVACLERGLRVTFLNASVEEAILISLAVKSSVKLPSSDMTGRYFEKCMVSEVNVLSILRTISN